MDIGLLTLGDLVTDPVTGRRPTPTERYRTIVESAVRAEAAGFVSVHVGEHHFNEYILSSPAVVLGAIAERTTSLRLSNGVALAANLDPVRVAEDYATVDVLSGGRVEPCFGRGTAFPAVYTFFGQDEHDARDRFDESVELAIRLWTDERVTWSGRFRSPLVEATVEPRPVQSPPPVWIGGGFSPQSVELAARLGCRLMLPTVFGTWSMFRPAVERYCELWEEYGHDPAERRIGACSHFLVGRDSEEVRTRWEPRYMAYTAKVQDWQEQSAHQAGRKRIEMPFVDFGTMIRTIAICGSPSEVIDRMGEAREQLHLDTQILMMDLGGIPDDELFEAIDLVGAEVIPALA